MSFQRLKTWKQSRDPDFEAKKNRVLHLYGLMDGTTEVLDGDPEVVICIDEFGPLNLQPHPGRQWTSRAGGGPRPRRRRRATYTRPHGVRHLLAAYDLSRDRLYGHGRATPPRPPRRWRPWLAVLVGALALALGVAACSGGGKTSGVASLGDRVTATTSAGGSQDERRAARSFARCMRQHGINMPDPNPEIQWGQLNQAPGWDAAWQACRQLLPASAVQQDVPPSAEELGQLRAFAVCMRAHGIDMSDPDPKNGDMTTGDVTRDQEQNAPP